MAKRSAKCLLQANELNMLNLGWWSQASQHYWIIVLTAPSWMSISKHFEVKKCQVPGSARCKIISVKL